MSFSQENFAPGARYTLLRAATQKIWGRNTVMWEEQRDRRQAGKIAHIVRTKKRGPRTDWSS